mgnify:CR=1 FL=1
MTIIAILGMSLIFTIVFAVVLKSRGPWGSSWTFFTINLLWLAAVSLWIPPAGPVWFGAPWIDLFVTGLLLSFLLSATPSASSRNLPADEFPDDGGEHADTTNGGADHSIHQSRYSSTQHKSPTNAAAMEHDSTHHSVAALRTGGIFWMLLLCLCALIIIGAI